ncbi:type VI secretion system protein ImpK [Izhakiella capsodis]|uniref:Type VI secretion system protein ImpK n=1 Tax=Izhakiella capsodis TaxID=1367852 RepID=A0A1I5A2P2_9GAMM|nr:type VI secretion system protein TssL, long form [Izhakiella capsodis]SFN56795.1 type VI secretion system protein ImpK [Izhakiella capsodis]
MAVSNEPNIADELAAFSSGTLSETGSQSQGDFLLDHGDPFNFARPGSNRGASDADSAQLSSLYDVNQLRTASVQQRVAKVTASEKPLLEAAQPLLRALSEMPEVVKSKEQVWLLKQALKNEVSLFSVVCDEADISWKKMAIVRYCLCTSLDEAAHGRPWGVESGWSQSNLLNHFEGDNDGGNKFFLLVGRLSMNPREFDDVLEILLRILGLGFEGRYSIIENGERQLTRIRQRLLTLLQSMRDSAPDHLSAHGLPLRTGKQRRRIYIPLRVSWLFAGVLLAGSFIALKYFLMQPELRIQHQMQSLERLPVAQIAPPMRLRLAILLKNEIAQKLVMVVETDKQSVVTFRGDSMFAVGSDSVLPRMRPVLQRVADEIRRVKGRALVVGYTDSMPINKPGFPDNQVLSVKRAENIARYLQQSGIPASNIRYEGHGDQNPLASNKTVEGRAKNRRVEIFVNY